MKMSLFIPLILAIASIITGAKTTTGKRTSSKTTTGKRTSSKTTKKKNSDNKKKPSNIHKIPNFDDDDEDDLNKIPINEKETEQLNTSIENTVLDATKKVAFTLGKAGRSILKSAVDLCVVKHVTEEEIYGKWLLRQEVEVKKGVFVSCPATVHFKEDGTVVTMFEGEEHVSKYTFKEKKWPLKCTIKFEARAFQETENAPPVKMLYKASFKGSLTNPRLMLMRGKIYRISGKMWQKQVRCGEFKALKRRYSH